MIDPAAGLDGRLEILIENGRIGGIGEELEGPPGARILDLDDLLVTPGLVDIHAHLREPGQEAKETIASGARAAAAGGFTTVCAMPNTEPVIDTPELVTYVRERGEEAGGARVLPIAAATRGSRGEEITNAESLVAAGAVALSDDGRPIATAEILADVLDRARSIGVPVADHCEVLDLSAGGVVLAGPVSESLGVRGIPPEAESEAVARDLEVLSKTGGRLHLCHLSTAASIDLVRQAKKKGLTVTAEVCPHHLTLTMEAVLHKGSMAKMNPPLATEVDRNAVEAALIDGTIDCVATDHAPHTDEDKRTGIETAPFGIVGFETAFGLLHTELVAGEKMSLRALVQKLTQQPARVFGLEAGNLSPGSIADVAVFDLRREWTVDPKTFRSRSRNTPWAGQRLQGRPVLTIVGGEVVFDER